MHVAAIDATNIHPSCQAPIALNVQEVHVTISAKYSDYINVFWDSTAELPEPTDAQILFICKKDGSFQPCVWGLNNLTIKNWYLLPWIEALSSWSKCQFRQKVCFLGYVVSSHVALTFRCLSNLYQHSIPRWKIAAPLTSMLKTSGSTDSTIRPRKGGVGVGGDGGEDGGHDDEHSPRGLGRVHQRIHQLVRPRLWSSMMRLMEVGVVLSKSCQKKSWRIVKKSEKPQRPEKLQRSSIQRNVYQSTDPLSIRYEELELSLKLWQFFELFLLGSGALSIPISDRLSTRQS